MKGKIFILLSFLAAIAYNSWILGFWLNPKIVQTTLLSALGALDQPYHQIFIISDIISGLLCIILASGIYRKEEKRFKKRLLFSWLCFGGATALAAIFAPQSGNFDTGVSELFTNPIELLHDGMSVLALLFLLVAVLLSILIYKTRIYWIMGGILALTCLISLGEGIFPGLFGPVAQQINSLTAGVWIVRITWSFLFESLRAE